MRERRLVLVAYVLSGAAGLVYQVVWTRLLSLTFGVTVFATSAVLAAFMAGLGLGSWLVGRRVDRSPDPLRVYALLEVGIGLYALAVPAILAALTPVYVAIAGRLEGQFLLFNLARATLAFLVLLVPTTLMGGTVPAIGRYLVTRHETVGWNVGLLYAVNTLGAVVGTLGAGFILIGWLGLWRTTVVTAAVNVGIGLGLLVMGRRRAAVPTEVAPSPAPIPGASPRSTAIRVATLVFAASGFTALAYEVVWTRVLLVHLHNSTYAFSAMLAMFLLGLAAGNAILMRSYDRVERPLFWLGTVEVGIGVSVVLAALAYIPLRYLGNPASIGWAYALTHMFVRAGLVLLPGAFLFGMTFPLVARVVTLGLGTVGRDLAGAYAANTLGGVLGSLVGGFVLVPALGLRNTLVALAAVNVCLGAACWLATTEGGRRMRLAALAVALAALPALAIPRTIFFDALESANFKLVYYTEGITDTSGVWESRTNGHRIVTYGDMRGTAGTQTDATNRIQAHVAHLMHPNPKRSLQICFGVGNTLAAAALHPEVEQLDCVELSPHVRQTAPYFWTNDNVLENPKVRLVIDDGRNFLLRTTKRYDVITLEPPDLYTAGVVNLFTEEFYRLAATALDEDGILCQWIPAAQANEDELRMLVAAFIAVFPETSLWREGRGIGAPLLLVGSKRPVALDVEALARRMQHEAVRGDLERLTIDTPAKLFELYITGPEPTRRWLAGATPVTDDRTVIDFTTPRSVYSGYGFGYFKVGGKDAEAAHRHLYEVTAILDRLREPPPWLGPRGAVPTAAHP
jgi:spermidine synthase